MKSIIKRLILFVITVAILLFFVVGCDSKNKTTDEKKASAEVEEIEQPEPEVLSPVENVEKLISKSSFDETEELEAARNAYYELSEEDRALVKNVEGLCSKIHSHNVYAIRDAFKSSVPGLIKKNLLNPESLQVHSISNYEYSPAVEVFENRILERVSADYSAQNQFGGYSRKKETKYLYMNLDDAMMYFCHGNHKEPPLVASSSLYLEGRVRMLGSEDYRGISEFISQEDEAESFSSKHST